MFSSRTAWNRKPTRLAARYGELRTAGREILDLTESNPTRCGFRYPAEGIRRAISRPGTLVYEPHPCGLRTARETIARRWTREAGVIFDPEEIVMAPGTSEAYAWLFKLLCAPQDDVLVPSPGYPLLDFLARLEDVRLRRYPLRLDCRWRIERDDLERAITPRTRAIVVVHPNNPTGSFLSRAEIAMLEDFCADRGLAIISDEVFAAYPFEDDARRLPTLAGVGSALTFCLAGLSKASGLPQLKASWIGVRGPGVHRAEALERLEIIGDTYLPVGTPVQEGLDALLDLGDSVRGQILERVRGNRAILNATRGSGAAWDVVPAEGGWYGVVRVPGILPEEEWALRLLEEDAVYLHPGYLFDFPGEAYLAVSLLPAPDLFREAADRLARRVAQFASEES